MTPTSASYGTREM